MSEYHCVMCHQTIETSTKCCDIDYHLKERYFRYSFDQLLFKKFKHKYLLNKSLNNNAYLAYLSLPADSLSMPERKEVKKFRDYIENQISNSAVILDNGCGIMEKPGYLDFIDKKNCELYGLDPIDTDKFVGKRIVGCSEFTPFPANKFDLVIFCTSLDHVCSLEDTLSETKRILKPNGKVILWVGCNEIPLTAKIKRWLCSIKTKLFHGYDPKRFRIYPDGSVFYIPKGCFDPFHSYRESPKHTIKLFKKAGYRLVDSTSGDNADQNFLTFQRQS